MSSSGSNVVNRIEVMAVRRSGVIYVYGAGSNAEGAGIKAPQALSVGEMFLAHLVYGLSSLPRIFYMNEYVYSLMKAVHTRNI